MWAWETIKKLLRKTVKIASFIAVALMKMYLYSVSGFVTLGLFYFMVKERLVD